LLWTKKHLGEAAYKRLILTHHKNLNHGDFLVDDRTKNGADRFTGEHIYFRSPRFPDWNAVVEYPLANAS
jgi:5'(3')-deoxyribonucleotidase